MECNKKPPEGGFSASWRPSDEIEPATQGISMIKI
jgi:hypothetical protein